MMINYMTPVSISFSSSALQNAHFSIQAIQYFNHDGERVDERFGHAGRNGTDPGAKEYAGVYVSGITFLHCFVMLRKFNAWNQTGRMNLFYYLRHFSRSIKISDW